MVEPSIIWFLNTTPEFVHCVSGFYASLNPWFEDALAVTGTVAVALAVLHRLRRLHLNLTPETLAIVPDRNGKPQPLLLDLGMIREMKTPGSDVTTLIPTELRWIDLAGDLGYLAPELRTNCKPGVSPKKRMCTAWVCCFTKCWPGTLLIQRRDANGSTSYAIS